MSFVVEACEPRQLLVVPTLSPGMTPAQIAAAWAAADAQATQDVVDAVANLDSTANSMQTQFDSIGSTLTTQQAANQAALEAADATTFAAFDAQLVVIDATYDAVVDPENADFDSDIETYSDDYDTGVETANDNFEATDTSNQAAHTSDLESAEDSYDSDLASLTATLNSTIASEQTTLDNAEDAAAGQYQTDAATASGILATAYSTAETGLTTALGTAGTTRDSNIAGFDVVFNTSVTSAVAARSFSVAPYPSIVYDATLADGDSGFQSTLQSAMNQYYLAAMNAQQDYQDDLDDADSNYDDAITAAMSWFSDQAQTNQGVYETDRQNALDSYESTISGPRDTRATNVAQAESNFIDDKQNALDLKQLDDTQAATDYSDSIDIAVGFYDGAVTTEQDSFNTYQTTRTNTFNGVVQTRTDAYQGARNGLYVVFDSDMESGQQTYDDDTATAQNNYVLAKQGAATTRDSNITTAYANYVIKVNDLRGTRNFDADLFWAGVYAGMATAMLSGGGMGPINDTPLLTIQQTYEIGVASEDVFLADAIGTAKVAFNTAERAAATTLATSNANDSETLTIIQGNAVLALATGLAAVQEGFQRDLEDLQAVFQIDVETKFVDMMKNIAVADWSYAYAAAAAGWQQAIDYSWSDWNYQYDLAAAQETYELDVNNENYNYAVIESGANETLQNNLATASATLSNSNAVDAETADNMSNAAGATWIQDQYQAYVDYVSALAVPYMTMVSAIANARAVAIVNAMGGGADVIIVTNAWRDHEIAVATADVFRAMSIAAEWQSYGTIESTAWQSAEDQKAAARTINTASIATAFTTQVSSVAAAQHTFDDNVALADRTFADADATRFRTFTEQQADADRNYAQLWANSAELYDQAVADETYTFEIDYWDRYLANYTVTSNADRDRNKSEQTELKNVLTEKAFNDYNHVIANAADKRAAAINGASEDQNGAISVAEKDRSKAVRAAYDNLNNVKARALITFSNAAYARLDAPGIGSMMSQGLYWVWNQFPDLDTSVNFVTGWSDSLTGGASGWVRRAVGIDDGVDYNSGAYRGGQIVGTVHSFMIGGAAGNLAHVGRAYTAARVITTTATVAGAVTAANNIKNGNGTPWDYLALAPVVGAAAGRMTKGLGIFQCFVGETPVVIAEASNFEIAAAGVIDDERHLGIEASLMVIAGLTITAGWLGKEALDERQRRGAQKPRGDVAREYDVDDPNRYDMVCDVTEPVAASELSVKEFDMLCDDLLSGDVEPCGIRGSRVSQSTSGSTTPTALSTREPRMPRAHSRHVSKLGLAWMWACLLIGGGLLWSGLSGTSSPAQPLHASVARTTTSPTKAPAAKFVTKPIQDLRVGDRVLARNPEVSDSERAVAIEPDPATWRHIELNLPKPDGSLVRVNLLRPLDWLAVHEATIGSTIHLDLEEMGASGLAEVLAINQCPQIKNGPGEVVTGTFSHSAGNVINLFVDGLKQPIGTTDNHPFWSEDRQQFVPAGELCEGETLRRADNTPTQLTRITPRRGPSVSVYNLEVNTEHVYFVGNIGVLVHNTYSVPAYLGPNSVVIPKPGMLNASASQAVSNFRSIPQKIRGTISPNRSAAETLAREVAGELNVSSVLRGPEQHAGGLFHFHIQAFDDWHFWFNGAP